jgi:glycine/D-amino acid oxidase-like deaminating enzyme
MLSFWEAKYFVKYDHIIIGSGIVGLSTAYYLCKRFPKHRILILERGLLPTGASTKNAGFACMGSLTELLHDFATMKEDEVLALFQLRKKGLERLRSILGDNKIGFKQSGSYELISNEELSALDQIIHINDKLRSITQVNAFKMANDKIDEFGFNKSVVKSLIENTCEGEIDTGLMMSSYLKLIMQEGIEIKSGCEVASLQAQTNEVVVVCKTLENQTIELTANKVYLCTNAFTESLIPNLDIQPGRGQVLITKPIENLKLNGIFHWDAGYYYFRRYEDRVLIGGGRNIDFVKENATSFNLNHEIQEELERRLREVILPETNFEIEQRWTGIMAFGSDKNFILKKHTDNIYMGVRMNGMGIAIGSEVGYRLANLD